jgi:hypothetical protein
MTLYGTEVTSSTCCVDTCIDDTDCGTGGTGDACNFDTVNNRWQCNWREGVP